MRRNSKNKESNNSISRGGEIESFPSNNFNLKKMSSRISCCAPKFLVKSLRQSNSNSICSKANSTYSLMCSDQASSTAQSDYKLMKQFAESDLYKSISEKLNNDDDSNGSGGRGQRN